MAIALPALAENSQYEHRSYRAGGGVIVFSCYRSLWKEVM